MMIRVWALPLAVLCALQCSVSAEPRPDFALSGSVYGAGSVSGAVGDLDNEVDSLTVSLTLDIESGYPVLAPLMGIMSEFGSTLTAKILTVLGPLGFLPNSDSGMGFGAFDATLSAISGARDWFDGRAVDVLGGLGELVNEPLPSHFADAFGRLDGGLAELGDAVQELADAVNAILNPSSGEECHRRDLPPRLVYRVAYAVRNLRGYVPLASYLIATTVENMRLLDAYLVRLAAQSEEVQDVTQYVELADAGFLPIETTVSAAVEGVQGALSAVMDGLSGLSNVQMVSSFSQVQAALSTFSGVLGQLSSASSSFHDALYDIGDALEELLVNPAPDVPAVNTAEVVDALALTLLSNGPFSRYCFYKYSELLFGFADIGLNGVEECIDREVNRMQFLQETLLRLVEALLYDFEDLLLELGVCDRMRRVPSRTACVNRLASEYSALANNYDSKFDLIFNVGIAEATASKHRLLACVTELQFRLIEESNEDLRLQIEACARHGPYCEEEEEEESRKTLRLPGRKSEGERLPAAPEAPTTE